MLSSERTQPLNLEAPIPKYKARIASTAIANNWISSEKDPKRREIKRRLVQGIQQVDFFAFHKNLITTANEFNSVVASIGDYALLWDLVPHKSKHWVWSLLKKRITQQPAVSDYSLHLDKKIEHLMGQGIKSLVIFDDASYSGLQLLEDIIQPIYEAAREQKISGNLTILFCIPYVDQFVPKVLKKKEEWFSDTNLKVEVKLLYSQTLQNGVSVLSRKLENYYRFECGRKFSDTPDDQICDHSHSLTVFDHKTADSHSVSWQVLQALGMWENEESIVREPYKDKQTEYYKNEKENFLKQYPEYSSFY